MTPAADRVLLSADEVARAGHAPCPLVGRQSRELRPAAGRPGTTPAAATGFERVVAEMAHNRHGHVTRVPVLFVPRGRVGVRDG
jgi:hypothetical protein